MRLDNFIRRRSSSSSSTSLSGELLITTGSLREGGKCTESKFKPRATTAVKDNDEEKLLLHLLLFRLFEDSELYSYCFLFRNSNPISAAEEKMQEEEDHRLFLDDERRGQSILI